MQCVVCKMGNTKKDKGSFTIDRNGAFIVFSNVDAEVCDNCGEAYFDTDTAMQLERKASDEFKKGLPVELIKLS